MRKIGIIFILLLAMVAVGVSAATYSHAYFPIVYSPPSTPTPIPTPHPPGIVEVLPNYSWKVDNGNLIIIGEVQNNTNDYVDSIEITVNIYNTLGQLIDPYSNYTYLDNALADGDKTFFMLSIVEPPYWSYFEFENPTYTVGGDPAPKLTILSKGSTWEPSSGYYYLWATVRNDDVISVNYAHVIVTIYDSSGKVIAGEYVPLEQELLLPGQTSGFMIHFADQDYSNVTYRLQPDGWRLP